MELQMQPMTPTSICEGCLIVDRKLSPIVKDESQRFFDEIFDPLDNINLPLMLCWECMALTSRFVKFKRQIKQAHELLAKYKTKQITKLPILSSLGIKNSSQFESIFREERETQFSNFHKQLLRNNLEKGFNENKFNLNKVHENIKTGTIFIEPDFNDKDEKLSYFSNKKNKSIEIYKETIDLQTKDSLGLNLSNCTIDNWQSTIKNCNKSIPIEYSKNKTEQNKDLQYIKFKNEGCDENDDLLREETGFGDEEVDLDVKNVIKTQEIYNDNSSSTNKKKIRKENKRREKIKNYEFNESDDEPLKFKKQNNEEKLEGEEKLRSEKKKKEDGAPKARKARRENPPGVVTNARAARQLRALNVADGVLQMVVRDWAEVQAERERMLASESFLRHEYKCYDCVVGFNHRAKLLNHMNKHDLSAGDFVCDVCKVRCKNKHSLCAHRRRHRVRWRCLLCGAASSRAAVSADHVARAHPAHTDTHTHVCPLCHTTHPTLGKLRQHMKIHAERQKCEQCGKTFRDKTSLRTHLFIHKGEKEFECPTCGKRFLFKKAMQVHMLTHNESEHLYCYECDMNFKNHMSYYQHIKYNLKHIDPAKLKHVCPVCDKKFAKAARLEEHNMAVHLKLTPIQCTVEGCNFSCSSRPVLRSHTRAVHRHVRARRNHVCHHCGNAYTTKKTLESHLRRHTNTYGEDILKNTVLN